MLSCLHLSSSLGFVVFNEGVAADPEKLMPVGNGLLLVRSMKPVASMA